MLRALIALSSSRNRRHHHYRRDLPSSLVRPPPPFLPNRPTEIATSSNRRAQHLSRNLSAWRRSSPRLHRAAENRDLRKINHRFPQRFELSNFASARGIEIILSD